MMPTKHDACLDTASVPCRGPCHCASALTLLSFARQYVTAAQEAQSKLVVAAKAGDSEACVAAGAEIKAAAEALLSAANPPIVWN
jgi:hypothetical protein